ncbi:hypothetical protein DFH07DRAFT_826319 [Mycena maculata]|uniref:Uncharacterized protein n=1 Tax=Mycena maculata TaxID=230809 RepID=A0AAD7IX18_9AGAR|nr:hypothetical protein DFH07DRAFT_826319 [Mycena maculata]
MSSVSDLPPVQGIYLQITFTELFLNGIYTCLFFITVYAMIFKRELHKKKLGLFLALIGMYILSTVHVACRWVLVKKAFIDQDDTSVSTLLYLLQPPLWLAVIPAVVLTANTLISDCVLIWRCWTVWNYDWKIVSVPLICTLAGAGLGFRSVAEQAAYIINPNLDRSSFVDFATPYFGLSLATTCLASFLIIVRIITMTEGATRNSRGYGHIIEIVVESAALYSVSLIVFLPFLVSGSFADGYPEAVVAQMTGMAPTLIVARVTFGLARPDASWGGPTTSLIIGMSSRSQHPNSNIVFSNDSIIPSDSATLKADDMQV